MIRCKLCLQIKNPKSNTHFFTDSIIRTALNEEGSSLRNRGFSFGFDPNSNSVSFDYQQIKKVEKIKMVLGRESTDEENEAAKNKREFSVDDCFCGDCEDKFTSIESKFSDRLIDRFRETDLTGVNNIHLNEDDSGLFRMFFLMQFWRLSVCMPAYLLPPKVAEFLRRKIYNLDYTELELLPLSVSYMETLPTEIDVKGNENPEVHKTNNMVNALGGNDPQIIVMNDFFLQLRLTSPPYLFSEFYGLTDAADYTAFFNYNINEFDVKVISDEVRSQFLTDYWTEKAKKYMYRLSVEFIKRFVEEFGTIPTEFESNYYKMRFATNGDKFVYIDEKMAKFNDSVFAELKAIRREK